MSRVFRIEKITYAGEQWLLTSHDMHALGKLDTGPIPHPETIQMLQQQGYEVLNYRQDVAKYEGCNQTVDKRGIHIFVGFKKAHAKIIQFLGL
ncbi:YqiA/YcfP family alpha/beta fold hydrolase [Candidatus Enterovibrio escicola]|nr:YqiA/YcfP family alpha/beta fold hydrolase [Candidatus Enterovibrio escacola]